MNTKGAGRPPELQRQLKDLQQEVKVARLVKQELKTMAELIVGFKLGRQHLIDSYPLLIERAVILATDEEKPDRVLLLGLIQQVSRLLGEDVSEESETGIARILGKLKEAREVNISQTNIYGREARTVEVVEGNSDESSGRIESDVSA